MRRSELADALALSTLPIIVARSTGPAIGAALYLTFGPAVTFGIATVLHLVFVVVLLTFGLLVADANTANTLASSLLIAAAAGALVSAVIIEPATTRAAFGPPTGRISSASS